MINLITSFYNSTLQNKENDVRNKELLEAVIHNVESSYIEKLHLFIDDPASEVILKKSLNTDQLNKVKVVSCEKQPLYSDFFSYANQNLHGKIRMIANSDIYLHACEARILERLDQSTVFALTRYEYNFSSPLIDHYQGSHDCFIFKTEFENSFLKNLQFKQNVWGSENVVIFELKAHHYNVFNPCRQIKIVHLHKSNVRDEGRIRINKGKNARSGTSRPVVIQ